jgi:hypothetical protein
VLDAALDINAQQLQVRRLARRMLRDYHGTIADIAASGGQR